MIEMFVIGAIVFGFGIGLLIVLRKKKVKSKDDIYPMW